MRDLRTEGTRTEFEWNNPNSRIERVLEIFKNLKPKSLLDVGCGNGHMAGKIREVTGISLVHGLDLQADKITAPPWLRLKQVDIDKEVFPYPDNSFESIYCGEVIEHVFDTDHLLHI